MEASRARRPTCEALPHGCAFHPRCPWAMERCRLETPALVPIGESGRTAACWLHAGDVAVPRTWPFPTRCSVIRSDGGRCSHVPPEFAMSVAARTPSTTASVAAPPALEGRNLTKYFS